MMETTKEPILDVAKRAAIAAAEVLRKYFGAAQISHKDGATQNLVTQADVEAEATILEHIRRDYPGHHFLLEEGQSTGNAASSHLWIVDPLDGTTNYAHGIPQFATSIAYAEEGKIQVAVIFDPLREELFHAIRGGGAFLNGDPISVSDRGDFSETVIATGFYYDRGEMMQRTLRAVERLFEKNVRGMRRFGGAALDQCWVACGRLDGFFEYQLSPWDYAAGSLIIEEAGGHVADRDGQELRIDSGHLIAGNAAVFPSLVNTVRW